MNETGLQTVPQNHGAMAVIETRQIQEVQGAMIMARKFPRDEIQAHKRIIAACSRKGLAEVAMYSYPRGNTTVTGPSIRLAEALQAAWQNINAEWIELDRKPSLGNVPGESTVMVYALDLESNTRRAVTFTVKHVRGTKKGPYNLNDERDIYELVANQAARRLRACILGLIPKDVQDEAIARCEKTLTSDDAPISDRVKKMVVAFEVFGVTTEMLEKRLGHKLEAVSPAELVNLTKIYNSIKDGAGKREDFFELPPAGDNKEDAPAQPTPQAQVKSIKKPENHAPQTQEAAKAQQREAAQPSAKQQASPATSNPVVTREALTRDILNLAKTLKLGAKDLTATFMEAVGKEPSHCTTEELQQVLQHMGGGNGN